MRYNPFIISESDKKQIMSLYGLLTEEVKEYYIEGTVTGDDETPLKEIKILIANESDELKDVVIRNSLQVNDLLNLKNNQKFALTNDEGKYSLSVNLDKTKKYRLFSYSPSDTELKPYNKVFTFNAKEQIKKTKVINFTLSTTKQLDQVTFAVTKGVQRKFFLTESLINVKDKSNSPITDLKIESFMGVKIKNTKTDSEGNATIILNHTAEDLEFTKDVDGKVITDQNPIQEKKNVDIIIKKNKYKKVETLKNITTPNKVLELITLKGEKDGKKYDLYFICNLKKLKSDLKSDDFIGEIPDFDDEKNPQFVASKIENMGYTNVKTVDMTGVFGDYKKVANSLPLDLFSDYGEQDKLQELIITTVIDVEINVSNEKGERLSDAKVDIYTDKDKSKLFQTLYTNDEGVIITKFDITDINNENDPLSNKSKLWLEITKKGYEEYYKSHEISDKINLIQTYLKVFTYEPNTTTAEYNKKTTFFRFVGKNTYDVNQKLDNDLETAEKRAKNDALNQFINSSGRYNDNKQLKEYLKNKVPPGGKTVYKKKYSNGYYAIVELTRRELNKYVKSVVKQIQPDIDEKLIIEFNQMTFSQARQQMLDEQMGKIITVFYNIDSEYVKELQKYQIVVDKLNEQSYNLRVNQNTVDRGYISTIFGFDKTNMIGIMSSDERIILKQSIYNNDDIKLVAQKINNTIK